MDAAIIILALAVAAVTAANLLAGPNSRLRAKWDAYGDRLAAGRTTGIRPPKPVTKRYLTGYALFVVAFLVVWFAWTWNDADSLASDASRAAIFTIISLLSFRRLYKEYRKPDHGSHPQDDFGPDEDW